MHLAVSGGELDEGEPVAPLVALAKEVGVDGVELWYPKNVECEGVGAVAKALRDAELRVVCVSSPTELYRPEGAAEAAALLTEAIDTAAVLGAPFANTYFGFGTATDDATAISAYARALRPCLAHAIARGVTIVLENEFDAFGWDPDGSDVTRRPSSALALVDLVGSPNFRLTFDAANYLFCGVRPVEAFEQVAHRIAYVHAKDGVRLAASDTPPPPWHVSSDSGLRYATCPLGDGHVEWQALLERMLASGFDGPICIEPHCDRDSLFAACVDAARYVADVSSALESRA